MRQPDLDLAQGGAARPASPAPPSPPATRLATPRWRDVRLLMGLLLVLAAVVLGSRLLGSQGATVPVWSAARDLAAGAPLAPGDVERVDVRLGTAAAEYVSASDPLPAGLTVTRSVAEGELLPAGAVEAGTPPVETRLVTVTVDRSRLPGSLESGDRVDVYVSVDKETPDLAPGTTLVVEGVAVAEVVADGGRLGPAGSTVGVVLEVTPEQVRRLVAAAQAGTIALVRVPGP